MWLATVLVLVVLGGTDAILEQWQNVVPDSIQPANQVGDKMWRAVNDNVPDVLNPLNLVYTNSCIEDLGCFYTGPPFFHPLQRPISLPPTKRIDEIDFLLFTQASPNETYVLEPNLESLENSTFNATHMTKVLIHGFLVNLDYEDIRYYMKDAVINDPADYNVIVVDWTRLNSPPYSQAVANTRVVGAQLAKLINFIINNTETIAENFHIVGHSLGGHIAGYAGERIEGLARITGLDPAGPYFRDSEPEVRLDLTDAEFVDVIHTDGGEFVLTGLGINEPIGHMDFYPNGGRLQPVTTQYINTACDHGRANDFYLETINNYECKFFAVQCSNYNDFEAGLCPPGNHTVTVMGFHNTPLPGFEPPAKFFLRTKGESQFCRENSIYV
ncbi:hypothetical protein JTE90_009132 [Oedothorax gibbosus]|uniref:Lipase domain-containing protein n=1 Tax=Oedothorax gibbosus TaxID=931172 RepID=A0AAV6TV25_9ARAC|nr:hypothetical protein JTE90_009132 [Oedothorax gibbosus]